MTIEVLHIIDEAMKEMNIPYAFLRYTKKPLPKYYFVGDYNEMPGFTEDNFQEGVVHLTGYSRDSALSLWEAQAKIKQHFPTVGETFITPSGSGVAILYDTALMLPTEDADFQRIQINLQIKEWSV